MYDEKTSIDYIEESFPSISSCLRDDVFEGLVHLQIAEFSRLAQTAIDLGNKAEWEKVTKVFINVWNNCTPGVKNALNVSFLEHLLFNNEKISRSWAYDEMPNQMRTAWNEMNEYMREIHGG